MANAVLADADSPWRCQLATLLRAAGHQVAETDQGDAALDLVRSTHPDLLVLQLALPGLTGFEVLDALRHDPAGARVRIIAVSSHGDAEVRLEAFAGGASEFLRTPCPPETAVARILHYLVQSTPAGLLDVD